MPWESRGRGNGGSAGQDAGGQRTTAGKPTCVGADEQTLLKPKWRDSVIVITLV